MIRHIVMLNLIDGADALPVMEALAGLVGQIDGFTGFEHGANVDLEQKSQDYPYGFVCTFRDQAALMRYAADPRHQVQGGRLVEMCNGGGDGIMVIDLEIAA